VTTAVEAAPAAAAAEAPAAKTNGKDREEMTLVVRNPISDGSQRLTFMVDRDAPACADCGAITVRSGACYKCMNCGSTTGCI
jgi:ribonucleoside-diphosphate reductase alpha chain